MNKGLDALKTLSRIANYNYSDYEYEEEEIVIERELKALELIKKYNVRPSDFHYHTTYKIYLCNMSFAEKDEIMSEEEYDLLKEVLK